MPPDADGGSTIARGARRGVASPAPGVEQRVGGSSLLRVVRAASRLVIRRSRHLERCQLKAIAALTS